MHERVLPPLDDAFAKLFGPFDSMQALRSQIEANLLEEKLQQSQRDVREHALEEVAKQVHVEIHESLIEEELQAMLQDMESRLQSQGGSLDEYLESTKSSRDAFKKENADRARARIVVQLVLRQVVEQQQLRPSASEVEREQRLLEKQYRSNRRLLQQVKSASVKRSIADRLARQRAIEYVMQHITIDTSKDKKTDTKNGKVEKKTQRAQKEAASVTKVHAVDHDTKAQQDNEHDLKKSASSTVIADEGNGGSSKE